VTATDILTLFLMGWFMFWFLRRELDEYRAFRAAEESAAEYVGIDDLLEPSGGDDAHADGLGGRDADQHSLHGRIARRRARRPDMATEPAYQFPGIPEGWSLDRYTRDGIQQITLHLVQAARRRP
jgi:hypothetical protein